MRQALRVLGIWVLLYCIAFHVQAQQVGFDNITIDDGLMHNNVNSIVQDHIGFMWFGTRDGLCRYDGYDFRLFPLQDSAGEPLSDQRIEGLFVDLDGHIWVMPTNGGLYLFNVTLQSFQSHPLDIPVAWWKKVMIQSVMRDSRGNFWIGTTENGVVRVDSSFSNATFFSTTTTEAKREITGEHCYSFEEDNSGRIWFGLSGLYVNRYDPKTDSITILGQVPEGVALPEYSYRRSLVRSGDTMWIGTEGKGVMAYDLIKEEIAGEVLEGVLVRDMNLTPDGELLIASDGSGLFKSSRSGVGFEQFTFDPGHLKSLSTNALYSLYIDRNGNVWIGTYNGGVNLLAKQQAQFATFGMTALNEQISGSNSVISFAGNSQDDLWVGLDGGGIWHLSISDESLSPLSNLFPEIELSSNVITSLYLDEQNTLWAGTFLNGLNKIDLNSGEVKIFRSEQAEEGGLLNNNVWDIVEDASGQIWMATLGGGLHMYDRSMGQFDQYLPQAFGSSLSDRNVRVLYLDTEQNLWIGTERGGLNKLLPDRKTFISWKNDPADDRTLQSNFINAITEDAQGNIWVGTEGGGLHRLLEDESGFVHYDINDGLPANIICSIEEDKQGRLWIGTSKGLAYLDRKLERILRFDQRDGLLSDQFNPNASLATPNGTLIFGSIKGINAVQPELININESFPEVVFTDLKVFDKSVTVGNFQGRTIIEGDLNAGAKVSLNYYDNAFTISFAALAYTAQQKVKYAYRLRGFNENWILADASRRSATYTNLDAGDYTFEVKASDVFGNWPEKYEQLEIIVHPPFWNTWWFKAIVVLLSLVVTFVILRLVDIRRREEQQRKLEQAQQEILRLKNEQLEREIKTKNSKLSAALLQSAHKNKALANLGDQLKEISRHEAKRVTKEQDLRKLVRKISAEVDSVDYWEQFQLNFDAVHQDFSHKLFDLHPNLTQNDIRLCSLIRVNMSNSEIGAIQNISKSGVEKSKYRLKQKLGLQATDDLHTYIQGIK